MNRFRRAMTVFTLGGIGTASWFGASALVKNVQFARAREQVEVARDQLMLRMNTPRGQHDRTGQH